MNVTHICSFHRASGSATVNGKTYFWDFSDQFGPLFTDRNGSELKSQPGPGSARFNAFETWYTDYRKHTGQKPVT